MSNVFSFLLGLVVGDNGGFVLYALIRSSRSAGTDGEFQHGGRPDCATEETAG